MTAPALDRLSFGPYREVARTEQVLLHNYLKFNATKLDGKGPEDAFSKDWDRLKNILHYNGQSIQNQYRDSFQTLDAIERIRKILPEDAENQSENLDRGFDATKDELQVRIVRDLNDYLDNSLGARRAGLKPEILWRFSQKALTQIVAMGRSRLEKKFGGQFPPKFNEQLKDSSITLVIPPKKSHSVKIIAVARCTYDRFIPNGALDAKDIPPIDFVGKAIYSVRFKKGWFKRTNVPETTARGEIKFSRPLPKAEMRA